MRFASYYGSNKSTGKETGKTHLCALDGDGEFMDPLGISGVVVLKSASVK